MSAGEITFSIESALLVVVLMAIVLPLTGCGSPAPEATPTTYQGICAVRPIGKDERGIAFFAYSCRPTEPQDEAR